MFYSFSANVAYYSVSVNQWILICTHTTRSCEYCKTSKVLQYHIKTTQRRMGWSLPPTHFYDLSSLYPFVKKLVPISFNIIQITCCLGKPFSPPPSFRVPITTSIEISQLLLWTWNDERFSFLVRTYLGKIISHQVKLSRKRSSHQEVVKKENLSSFHRSG